MFRACLISSLIAFVFIGFARADAFISEEYGFTINLPAGWEVKDGTASNTIIKAVYRDASGKLALISVSAYRTDAEGDIWDVSPRQMFEALHNEYPGAETELLDSGKTVVDGEHAIWTFVDVRSPPIVTMLTRSYYFVREPFLFTINTSTDRGQTWFEQHAHTFEKAVASFRFLNENEESKLGSAQAQHESLWTSFFKAYGKTFLMVAGMAIAFGLLKLLRGKIKDTSNSAS
jgi:hypothetical protein